jgi:hypothetical protein
MRRLIGIGLVVMAAAGCADGPKSAFSSSTEGTTMMRVGTVQQILPPAAAEGPPRLLILYDDGGSAMIDTAAARDFHAGDRVRVSTRRNAISIDRLGP